MTFQFFIYIVFSLFTFQMLSHFLVSPSKILYPLCLPLLPNPPNPIPGPGIHLYWGKEPSQDQEPLLPLMPNRAILCYICSWSHGWLHVYTLVGGLVAERSRGSGWLMLFFLWGAYSFSSFSPFSNSSIGDPVLSPVVDCWHLPLYLWGSGRAS